MDTIQELVGYQRAEFDKAATLFYTKFTAQLTLAAMGTISLFVSQEAPLYWIAGISLLVALAWLLLELKYRAVRANAERARRATLIMGGLGKAISKSELHDIEESLTSTAQDAKSQEDPEYFASRKPPGTARLTEMLEESAYWTLNLQRSSGKIMFLLFFLILFIALIAFYLLIPSSQKSDLLIGSRVVCAILTFLVSNDMFGQVRAYQDTAKILERLMLRIDIAVRSDYPEPDVLLILSDYNATAEATPLTLPFVYRSRKADLIRNWQKRAS
ncbi:hypothetical protein E0H65_22560 [Rhizobium leguminosarum bv. viciae]|nr:hypothetical protein E0H65_22560 [Rhizobium leguminosarum bv. viciae]